MHIVMAAAENGALPGAKVGGIGDVLRDVPRALCARGHQVSVILPGYQSLSRLPQARFLLSLTVEFANGLQTMDLFEVEAGDKSGVRHYVLEHPLFGACGAGHLYCHDVHEPFATDATKFALFSLAVCHVLVTHAIGQADVLHLHDWHTASVLLLREYQPGFRVLKAIPTVFTIHNLSLQGIRPFTDNRSSLQHWFPGLDFDRERVVDPRYPDCINLMRCGINLSDRLHVVSPNYAREILLPSQPELGLVRGEGLEQDLQAAEAQGRLFGILNGCEYPATGTGSRPGFDQLISEVSDALESWVGDNYHVKASWFHAQKRVAQWAARRQKENFLVTSVGRLTPQKVSLLQVQLDGSSALDRLLLKLDRGCMVMLGSGDQECEQFMLQAMMHHPNFLYLCGYSEKLGDLLYRIGDLFLMPSTFEPCGISQMLAMRAGTPCLVHQVGGLADTVQHMVNGFSFAGNDSPSQARTMLNVFGGVLQLHANSKAQWRQICRAAEATRFSWEETVERYEQQLYT